METSTFRTRTLQDGIIVPQKVWITFSHNSGWLPLEDWDGNQLFWVLNEKGNLHPSIKQMAKEKFPNTSWGLSFCEQKNMNNCVIDNL